MLDLLAAHQRAQGVFAAVLGNVQPHQMEARTPCSQWSVRDLIEHVIGGNERVVVLAGLRSTPAPRPSDLVEAHRVTAAAAQAVFAAPGGLAVVFELPIGPVPGSAFLWIRATDAFTHAWDLATATGQPSDLDPGLAAELLALSRQNMTGSLRGRVFGDPQPCGQGRPPADQLAAFLGRPVG